MITLCQLKVKYDNNLSCNITQLYKNIERLYHLEYYKQVWLRIC